MNLNRSARSAAGAVVAVLTVVSLAACGGGSSSKSATTKPTPTSGSPTTNAPGTGPSTAHLTFVGDARVAGALTLPVISCSFPGVLGLTITVLARTHAPKVSTFVFVSKAAVTVRITSGSGATYLQRAFSGKGVTGFDAARGAQINAELTEIAGSTAAAKAALPAVTSLAGAIDCASQRPGSSTIALSGPTGAGVLSGKLNPVRVECATNTLGNAVSAAGITTLSGKGALVFINGQPTGFTISISTSDAPTRIFKSAAGATVTTTETGMHVDGDAVEQVGPGATAHTVHAFGDAVCGASGRA